MTDTTNSRTSAAPEFRRCRSVTVLGRPCQQRAQIGKDFCVAHARNRFPVCPQGDRISIPLLEDLPTIRVVATQVAHGLFTQILDPWRAGKILYALQVAASTLPRPPRANPTDSDLVNEQPVSETFLGPDGHIVGPEAKWAGLGARYEPTWRHDKYLYEEECRRLRKPLPKGPADMPPDGWLTREEEEDPEIKGVAAQTPFRDRMLSLRIEADREGRLPPLEERPCAYAYDPYCKGPRTLHAGSLHCHYCALEREEHLRQHPEAAAPSKPGRINLHAAAAPTSRRKRTPVRRSRRGSARRRRPGHAQKRLPVKLSTQYIALTSAAATQTASCPPGGGGYAHNNPPLATAWQGRKLRSDEKPLTLLLKSLLFAITQDTRVITAIYDAARVQAARQSARPRTQPLMQKEGAQVETYPPAQSTPLRRQFAAGCERLPTIWFPVTQP